MSDCHGPVGGEPDRADSVWAAFAYDPITETLHGLDIVDTEEEAKQALALADTVAEDAIYRRAFNLFDAGLAQDFSEWLRSCGVNSAGIPDLMAQVHDSLKQL